MGAMRTVYWKRPLVVKFVLVPGFCIILLFIYFCSKPGHRHNNPGVQPSRFAHKTVPYLDFTQYGNFEPAPEPDSDGPGEGGKPFYLPANMSHEIDKSVAMYNGISILTSDHISFTRSLRDTRLEECKYWNYPENMGLTVSVIIVFHNEGFSTLMRNVHQVLARTPTEMLHEIILVDDCSAFDDVEAKLETYLKRFKGKIRLFKNNAREGLIRTRTYGAKQATGDVLVFLDAHCEVNRNWLPPLLAPIYKDRRIMTVPFVDGIDYRTFEYRSTYKPNALLKGIWEWGLLYKETELSPEQTAKRNSTSEPYNSPTHAGGLFAIDRKYFEELGYYDDGLEIWGGEQYELSFKIWQCGGKIQWVPCSRVGHIYRGSSPVFAFVPDKCKARDVPNLGERNHKRVIEVWWEPKQREFYYTREPLARFVDPGDISKQLEFRRSHNCKSFDWYMENVAPDQLKKFPELPPNVAWGGLANEGTKTCVDSTSGEPGSTLGLGDCHGMGNQLLRLNEAGQLGIGEWCIDMDGNKSLNIFRCSEGTVDGPWAYDKEKLLVLHKKKKHCLAASPKTEELVLKKCEAQSKYQRWTWMEVRP